MDRRRPWPPRPLRQWRDPSRRRQRRQRRQRTENGDDNATALDNGVGHSSRRHGHSRTTTGERSRRRPRLPRRRRPPTADEVVSSAASGRGSSLRHVLRNAYYVLAAYLRRTTQAANCTPPSGTRGLFDCVVASLNTIVEGGFGLWPAAYRTTAVRGRYQPIFIAAIIAAYIPWRVLPSGGRGP